MAKVIQLVIALVMIVALVVSPFSIPKSMDRWNQVQELKDRAEVLNTQMSQLEANLSSARQSFEESRTFKIKYDDAKGLVSMLQQIPDFNVMSISVLDATRGYLEVGEYTEDYEEPIDGLKVVIEVTDMQRALDIINSMQLCILSISAEYPTITVSFNTRGV